MCMRVCMTAQWHVVSILLTSRKERATSARESEKELVSRPFIASLVYVALAHTPLDLILSADPWEDILLHLCLVWEKLMLIEVG